MSRVVAVIPARRGSTRLAAKMLADVGGTPLVVRTWKRVTSAGFHRVVVATDDDEIAGAVRAAGGEAIRTGDAPNGTVRVAEAWARLGEQADVVVNVQGDEPLVLPAALSAIAAGLTDAAGAAFDVSTGAAALHAEEASRPERVKVVATRRGLALYFSRAAIPAGGPWRGHVGVYAFRPEVLARVSRLPPSPLEEAERLEQLRWLEEGVRIRVVEVASPGPAVDTAADLDHVRAIIAAAGSMSR